MCNQLTELAKLFVPGIAVIISVLALFYSRRSWLDSNRPLITLRVSSQGMAGNVATPLSLIIENTGNRPAIDIVVKWHGNEYLDAFRVPASDERRAAFEKTYFEGVTIAVLANGRELVTSFGYVGPEQDKYELKQTPTWRGKSRFNMNVSYQDLDSRTYNHVIPLIMADDEGFGGGIWKVKE